MINKESKLIKWIPHIAAMAMFLVISALYFAPQFEGKELYMGDMVQYHGMSKEIVDHQENYHEDPQWTGAMFGGMPAQLITMQYDSMILKPIMSVLGFLGRPASMIFVAMLAFFVMLLMFRVNPWVAIVPSLAYGLSTYFFLIIDAGHITKMIAAAYAPLMVGGVYYTLRRNMWLGAALTALFASLELAANHPQITYYFLFVLAALWINEGIVAFREHVLPHFAKATGLLLIAGVFAVGSNLAPLYYINEFGKVSMRGGSELTQDNGEKNKANGLELQYATQWSYGKMESFNMYIPDFKGGGSSGGFSDDGAVAEALSKYGARSLATQLPGYWGDQPGTGGPTYIGAVVIYLCVLGLFLLRGRWKWWVLAVTAIAIMLAWGSNFMWFTKLFFNYVPGYNKFRTVAMILVVAQWSVPFLAAIILNKIYKSDITRDDLLRGVKQSLYVAGGVALFFLISGGVLFDFSSPSDEPMLYNIARSSGLDEQGAITFADNIAPAMSQERLSMFRSDSLRSLILVLLSAGTILLFALGKLKRWLLVLLLAGLVCADLIPINLRYLPQSKFVKKLVTEIVPTAADVQIKADTEPGYRVFNATVSTFNDATTSYFHRSVGGYHGAKIRRYQDIIDRYLSKGDMEILNMLNTKYIIVSHSVDRQPYAQLNPEANGAAWFVRDIKIVDSPDEEIAALATLDTKNEAVVDKKFISQIKNIELETDSSIAISLTEYRPNYLKYDYTSDVAAVAVFSEIYYEKGWEAYLDGAEAPYFRADYILRGMVLPAGQHTVEFRYRADHFSTMSTITLVSSVMILLFVAGAAGITIYNNTRKRKEADNAD